MKLTRSNPLRLSLGVLPLSLMILCEAAVASVTNVPSSVQYVESFPSVIPADGTQKVRLRVSVGRPVQRVFLSTVASGASVSNVDLVDNGTNGDAVAADGIYTSREISITPPSLPLRYLFGSQTFQGQSSFTIGGLSVTETNGSTAAMFTAPEVGLLDTGIQLTEVSPVSAEIQAASHVVNVRQNVSPASQDVLNSLRGASDGSLRSLTQKLYQSFPDRYDFIVAVSPTTGEFSNFLDSRNFTAGRHYRVQNAVSGIGQNLSDSTALYGSGGRLLSVNVVKPNSRGMHSNNILHEMTHQWGANLNSSLGIALGGHWNGYSSVGSILGGFKWALQPNGTWLIESGPGKLKVMAPLDRYLAGFIPASEVPDLYVYNSNTKAPGFRQIDGDPIFPSEIVKTVTMNNITAIHGARSPSSGSAQKQFNTLFVVESVGRLLTQTEMTFYNRLAAEFERELSPSDPDPVIEQNWVPATRYFGPGTSISSSVADPFVGLGRIEAESYLTQSGTLAIYGDAIGNIGRDDWAKYQQVDFGGGAEKVTISLASDRQGGRVNFHVGAFDGPKIGTATIGHTDGWDDFEEVTVDLTSIPVGVQDLYLVFKDANRPMMDVDWFEFYEPGEVDSGIVLYEDDFSGPLYFTNAQTLTFSGNPIARVTVPSSGNLTSKNNFSHLSGSIPLDNNESVITVEAEYQLTAQAVEADYRVTVRFKNAQNQNIDVNSDFIRLNSDYHQRFILLPVDLPVPANAVSIAEVRLRFQPAVSGSPSQTLYIDNFKMSGR